LTGVGRTSVREALAALRLMGVIETRVGDGSYVREAVNSETVSNGISQAIQQSEEALQLQEARAVFECGLVRLVSTRWTPAWGKKSEELLLRMERCADDLRYGEYIRLHRAFHLLLAQATDNAIVEQTERSFLEFMDHEGWRDMEQQFYLPNRKEYLSESVAEHRAIIQAISEGNGQGAAELMHNHFARYGERENG
jgi:GntR family transcriptional repressor for pyruvate dehydrogenase complex